ncbi:MAG: hypothetical protein IJD21_06120 [Oscillospiraceae bacterium]|nr:hypothetical protein [Oscillospiraceae bacterium]
MTTLLIPTGGRTISLSAMEDDLPLLNRFLLENPCRISYNQTISPARSKRICTMN